MKADGKIIRAVDLCAGAGGWACAARGLPIRIVAAVDFWQPACRTYRLNHPATTVYCEDLRDPAFQAGLLAGHRGIDLVLGGIPCEWLSIRRNVGNPPGAAEIESERRTLRAALALVKVFKPRWWCLEDVKNIVRELPAGTPWIELDSADYSPQRRRRVYVGNFPRPTGQGPPLRKKRCAAVMDYCLRPGPHRIGSRTFGRIPDTNATFAPDKVHAAFPGRKSPTICCLSSRRDAEMVVVDKALPGGMRQMEWQEAARLQGFPEDYVFAGSPTDVWNMIGRAVQIDTARVILESIVAETERKKSR